MNLFAVVSLLAATALGGVPLTFIRGARARGLVVRLALPFLVGYDYFMWVDDPKLISAEPIRVRAFYLRPDAKYGGKDKRPNPYAQVPSLWKRLHYSVRGAGKSRHPDVVFKPKEDLTLAPCQVYDVTDGSVWLMCLCGTDEENWKKALDEVRW